VETPRIPLEILVHLVLVVNSMHIFQPISLWYLTSLAVDFAILMASIILFRYSMAWFVGVGAKHELDQRDNGAFGIAVAGGLAALMFIVAGAISGDAQMNVGMEATNVLIFTLVGFLLLKVTLLIQDRLLVSQLDLMAAIKGKNVAAGIVVGSNLVAIGIIQFGALIWIEADNWQGLIPFLIVFAAAQIALALVVVFQRLFVGWSQFGLEIEKDNRAVAIHYGGQVIGSAVAVLAASFLVLYTPTLVVNMFLAFLTASLVAVIVLWILAKASVLVALAGIKLKDEINNQHNIALGSLMFSVYLGIGIVLLGLVL